MKTQMYYRGLPCWYCGVRRDIGCRHSHSQMELSYLFTIPTDARKVSRGQGAAFKNWRNQQRNREQKEKCL